MRKVLFLLPMMVLISVLAMAQKNVTGRVVSEGGEPVPFASVVIKGSKTGTDTDADGRFTIRAKETDVLVISTIGYKAKEVKVGTASNLGISLERNPIEREAVVVTGAFNIKRSQKQQVNSIQVLKAEQVNTTRQTNLTNALAGKVVGTQARSQSGAKLNDQTALRIRGGSGLTGERGAIFVVDGTIVNSFDINPDDIETVNVLKGANATVLFGDRAANGAVVITTRKKGPKNGIGLEVNQSFTFDQVAILPRYQNKYAGGDGGFRTFNYVAGMPAEWQALNGKQFHDYTDDASWGPRMDGSEYIPWYAWIPGHSRSFKTQPLNPNPSNVRDFWENGFSSNFNVGFTKATENSSLRLSYTNQYVKGVIPTSRSTRHTLALYTSADLSKKFTVGANLNYSNNAIYGEFADGYSNQSTGSFSSWFHRNLDLKIMKELQYQLAPGGTLASWNFRTNPDGYNPANPGGFYKANYWYNFYSYFNNVRNSQRRDRFFGDASITYKIMKDLSVKATLRKNQLTTNAENITTSELQKSGLQTGAIAGYGTSQTTYQEYNYEAVATYRKKIKDFSFDVLGGGNILTTDFKDVTQSTVNGLKTEGLYAISNSVANPTLGNTRQKTENRALFAQVDASYKSLVNLTGAIRSDWYSVLPVGKNNLVSKSGGAGLIISEIEGVRNSLPWLTYAKVFGSYGEKPLPALGFGSALFAYTVNQNSWAGNLLQTTPNQSIDPNIQGINIVTKEYGVDLKFAKNRIGLIVTLYDEFIEKEAIAKAVSGISGFTSQLTNAGVLNRKGIEFETYFNPIKKQHFNWDMNFNVAKILDNKVVDTDNDPNTNDQRFLLAGGAFGSRFARVFQIEGKNAYQLVGGGIKRNAEGKPILNDDGTFQNDALKEWGSTVPEVTGGLFNTFRYKNFNLAVNIDYQFGGKFFALSEMWGHFSGLFEATAHINDRGKEARDPVAQGGGVHVVGVRSDGKTPFDVYVPAQDYYHQFYFNQVAEPYVHDLTFIKLREVSLGYDVPMKKLGVKWLQGANFSVIARNPILLYRKAVNFDPSEISAFQGEDGQLPSTRSIGFNLRLTF